MRAAVRSELSSGAQGAWAGGALEHPLVRGEDAAAEVLEEGLSHLRDKNGLFVNAETDEDELALSRTVG